MQPYLPPKMPLTAKQAAEQKARRISTAISVALWVAIAIPILFALMAYGYSDQAPAALRHMTLSLDSAFGSPVWSLIGPPKPP